VTAAAAAAVMVGLAGVIVLLMASTVPTGAYDDAVADLEAAQTEAIALAEENSALTADLDALAGEREQLVASIEATAVAAKAMAYMDLNMAPEYVGELARAGWDFASYDELLAVLGEDMTLTEWIDSNSAFWTAEQYVYMTDDRQLIDAWNAWLGMPEIGSLEDQAAYAEILVRLDHLINERLALTTGDAAPSLTASDAG
jgi:hypothetical protein